MASILTDSTYLQPDLIQEKSEIRKNNTIGEYFLNLLTIIILIKSTFGITVIFDLYTIPIQCILFFIWVIIASFNDKSYFMKIIKDTYPMLFFLMINISIDLISRDTITEYLYDFILLEMLYCIYLYYEKEHYSFKKLFLYIFIFEFFIVSYSSISLLKENPYFIRDIGSGIVDIVDQYRGKIYGNFTYLYGLTFYSVYIFFILRNLKFRKKYLVVISLITALFLLISANFFIASLTAILSSLFFWITYQNNKFSLLKAFIFIVVLFFFKTLVAEFFLYLSERQESNTLIAEKYGDIAGFLNQDGSSMQTDFRILLYTGSLGVFFEHPFTGVYSLDVATNYLIGGHSSFLDALARFGLFRFLPFLFFLYTASRKIYYNADEKCRYATIVGFSIFLLLQILNPIYSITVWFFLFILIPFSNDVFIKADEENKDDNSKYIEKKDPIYE